MITTESIRQARERLGNELLLTPCPYSEALSRLTGCEVYLKLENLQTTGSFKLRGALNKILQLNEQQRAAGVIAASAGNHAQGVARAAASRGIHATIVMPETTPLAKIRGSRELGAEVILFGSSYDEAFRHALELQKQRGLCLVHAFDDAEVIAGQGTIGLEILEQVPEVDLVVVPVGGGGLIAGIATALKQARPDTRIIGVESERLPAMQKSLLSDRRVMLESASTIADGIAVAQVGKLTLPIVRDRVDGLVTVSEEETAAAVMLLLEHEKTLAEGAGAVGFAALHNRRLPACHGRKVVIVISGGNIDMNLLSRIIERGLEHDGRLARLKVVVPDKPGSIAEVTRIIAGRGANVFDIAQNRHADEVQLGEKELELTLETRDREHVGEIVEALRASGLQLRP